METNLDESDDESIFQMSILDTEFSDDLIQRKDFVDKIFDSTNEILKGLVREIFTFNRNAVDGICAAAIHIFQSQHLQGYYRNRKYRLDK